MLRFLVDIYDESVFEVNSKKNNKKNKKYNKNISNNDSQAELKEVRECLDENKEILIEKVSYVFRDQIIVEDNVQNQVDRDVIDHNEKVDSVEEVIGVCSGCNESNDDICIEKENEVMSDEKVIDDGNKIQGNSEPENW
nr:hypothetical protein [Tanacetum cinerariifolium]